VFGLLLALVMMLNVVEHTEVVFGILDSLVLIMIVVEQHKTGSARIVARKVVIELLAFLMILMMVLEHNQLAGSFQAVARLVG